jgi:predicted Zn-dependent protease
MMAAMWYMVEGGEEEKVDALYRQMGTNYYHIYGGKFRDVLQYNGRRAFVYARAANLIKDKRERLERAKEAVELGPKQYYTNYVVGRALLSNGDGQAAMDYLRRSIEINPDYLWTHYMLARAEEISGKRAEALERARALLERELDSDLRESCEALVRRNS